MLQQRLPVSNYNVYIPIVRVSQFAMSVLPGLGLSAPVEQAQPEPQSRTINLAASTEWRFEVPPDGKVSVKVLPALASSSPAKNASDADTGLVGTAEVFGTELAPNHTYDFSGLTKAAIYTHYGCSLSISGTCESEYVAEETPMTEYLNVHFALENLRSSAEAREGGGPRVLVVGPEDAGKTTLVKMLTAYASRVGRTPLVVNLDPHEGMLCLPGSVSAAAMGSGAVLDVEDAPSNGWGSSPISGPSPVPVKLPLVYHFGYAGPEERTEMFKPVATRLALAATSRFEDDPDVREAGLLVDIAGSACSGKKAAEIIGHVVSEFSITVLLVIGSERLSSDMNRRYGASINGHANSNDEPVHVIKLPKSGGCVDRDETYMRQLWQAQIRNYFFGGPKNTLSPHTTSVDFGTLNIFRMVDPASTNLDFLPGGANDDDDNPGISSGPQIFERVTPSLAMSSALLAIKHAPPTDTQEAIRDASVMGYLYVADVDEPKKRIRVLSPLGGRLPINAVVWGMWDGAGGMGDLLG